MAFNTDNTGLLRDSTDVEAVLCRGVYQIVSKSRLKKIKAAEQLNLQRQVDHDHKTLSLRDSFNPLSETGSAHSAKMQKSSV